MKSVFYTIATLIMITLVGTLSSCDKEMSSATTDWKSEIRSYVSSTQDATSTVTYLKKEQPNPWACMAADFMGAMALGEIGCIGGPWGAFAGGLIGGVAGSVSVWRVYNPDVDSSSYNYPVNPYDRAGELHNTMCQAIVEDSNLYFTNDGHMTQAYQDMMIELIMKERPDADMNQLESLDYNGTVDNIKGCLENGDVSFIADSDLQFISKEFLKGIKRCSSEEETFNFIIGFQQIVENSNLSDSKKEVALTAISVASHSNHLWKK